MNDDKTQEKEIDISKISPDTIKRLEAVIEACNSDTRKAEFYRKVGNKKKAAEYGQKFIEREEDSSMPEIDRLEICLRYAEKYLGEAEQRKIAAEVYRSALEAGKKERAFDAGKKAGIPAQEMFKMQEELLLEYMTEADLSVFNGYNSTLIPDKCLTYIQKFEIGLPAEKVRAIAIKAYDILMGNKGDCNEAVLLGYLNAGMLAKRFNLGDDKVKRAGKKILEASESSFVSPSTDDIFEAAIKEFDVPEKEIGKAIDYLVGRWREYFINRLDAVRAKYGDEKIKQPVQEEYNGCLMKGKFDHALRLRLKFNDLINDSRINLDELKTLEQITREYDII